MPTTMSIPNNKSPIWDGEYYSCEFSNCIPAIIHYPPMILQIVSVDNPIHPCCSFLTGDI